ncbi:MAG TPA: DNA repair protein RadA [Spirochaetota bacterium]|nr:DNA repair protein RadA [Spirochaetota bacterium]
MKIKKRFVCKECGYSSPSWLGKCPECLSWNSFVEEEIENPKSIISTNESRELFKVEEIKVNDNFFIKTQNDDINNFFGDGIVSGSVLLLAGEPGIGKSTFLLYLTKKISDDKKIFYFSGEESTNQIKKRVDRTETNRSNLFFSNETEIERIIEKSKTGKPDIIFIDSIQTCYTNSTDSLAGSISQIKHSVEKLIQFAKSSNITVFVVGHITKSGDIAGPKVIEHLVDVVIYFENNLNNQYRLIRSTKNRFGSIDEILIFELKEKGLFLIESPANFFIDDDKESIATGKCKTVIIEGKRPLIIEVEALVIPTSFTNPKRVSEGIDVSRLNRISAILTKHLNENLNNYDIYFNISGGIKTKDVGIDLAIAASIYSSKNKKNISNEAVYLGELSLTGKVKNIYKLERRVKEAEKFGMKKIFIPTNNELKGNSINNVDNITSIGDLYD